MIARRDRALLAWLAAGAAGFILLPWYALQDSLLSLGWLRHIASKESAPALIQGMLYGRAWLLVFGALLVIAVVDGRFGLGQSIGEQAVRLGIEKAKATGLSAIASS